MEQDVVAELTLLALLRTRGFDTAADYFAHNGFPRPAQEILARWRMAGVK